MRSLWGLQIGINGKSRVITEILIPYTRWKTCKGERQSPIDIDLGKVVESNSSKIKFVGYDLPIHGELYDNGHSLSK